MIKTASCTAQMNYFKTIKNWRTDINELRPLSICFVDWDNSGDADHVFILLSITNGIYTIIDGNSGEQTPDKTTVKIHTVNATSDYLRKLVGFAYADKIAEVNKKLPTLQMGCESALVKALQIILTYKGYDLGTCGCDGDFGIKTKTAVQQFQADHKIETDGIVGPNTWRCLCE